MAGRSSATCIWATGPADGPADQRDRASGHRADLFRRIVQRSVPGRIAGDDGGPGGDLSGRLGRLQGRSGAAGGSQASDGGAPGRPSRLPRFVGAFLQGLGTGIGARIFQPRRPLRPVEGRGERRCADPAADREDEGRRPCRGKRRRADRLRRRGKRQEGDAAGHPGQVRRRGELRDDRSRDDRRPRRRAGSGSHPLRRRPAPASAFRAGVPRRAQGAYRGPCRARARGLRHDERHRRQAVQDARRRGDEAPRPHCDDGKPTSVWWSRGWSRTTRKRSAPTSPGRWALRR